MQTIYTDYQIAILRQLNNCTYVEHKKFELDTLQYLATEGVIAFTLDKSSKPYKSVISITPKGKAYLRTLDIEANRYHEPLKVHKSNLRVSYCALAISILALLQSFGLFEMIVNLIVQ